MLQCKLISLCDVFRVCQMTKKNGLRRQCLIRWLCLIWRNTLIMWWTSWLSEDDRCAGAQETTACEHHWSRFFKESSPCLISKPTPKTTPSPVFCQFSFDGYQVVWAVRFLLIFLPSRFSELGFDCVSCVPSHRCLCVPFQVYESEFV